MHSRERILGFALAAALKLLVIDTAIHIERRVEESCDLQARINLLANAHLLKRLGEDPESVSKQDVFQYPSAFCIDAAQVGVSEVGDALHGLQARTSNEPLYNRSSVRDENGEPRVPATEDSWNVCVATESCTRDDSMLAHQITRMSTEGGY